MSDLFHDQVPDEHIANVWGVMAWTPHHTFQILTKRHARMRSLLSSTAFKSLVDDAWYDFGRRYDMASKVGHPGHPYDRWPLPNVWLGVSAENQQWADIRIPALLDTPAAVRFISAEPLLGPIDIFRSSLIDREPGLDWVIVGGESGAGSRPMHPGWARRLRDECVGADIPFLFKQWGNWIPSPRGVRGYSSAAFHYVPADGSGSIPLASVGDRRLSGEVMRRVAKHLAGRELDGRTWDEYPEVVRGT
jgi:protein gp37